MKILKTNNSQLESFRSMSTSPFPYVLKEKVRPEFDLYLEEFLNEDSREWDEYPVLLPRHGRYWDNGYEDVE